MTTPSKGSPCTSAAPGAEQQPATGSGLVKIEVDRQTRHVFDNGTKGATRPPQERGETYPGTVINQPDSMATRLRATLVAAFPGYLRRRLADIGLLEDDALAEVVAAATRRLGVSLGSGLEREAPLELVRRATEPVTAALRERDVAPVSRDARSVELHPDDLFDLYPATSRDLGEDVWRVHMQWGLERARQVAGVVPAQSAGTPTGGIPTVALFGVDEPLRGTLADRLRSLGYRPLIWRNPAALEDDLGANPLLTLVDLGHPTAEEALRRLVAEGSRVIAFGDGVTDFTQAAVMALGAEEVIESDRILELLDGSLPRIG